jgi:hypothetical protein
VGRPNARAGGNRNPRNFGLGSGLTQGYGHSTGPRVLRPGPRGQFEFSGLFLRTECSTIKRPFIVRFGRMSKSKPSIAGREIPRFRIGDRVRLSALGEMRNPRKSAKVGTVISLNFHKSLPSSVRILFDGQKEPSRLHWTYVERIDYSARGHG